MALARFYLYREKLIVPTVALTDEGFYLDIDPISIIDIHNRKGIEETLLKVLSHSNSVIPAPESGGEAGSAILEKLNLQKWSSFEKFAVMYSVHLGGSFITVYVTGRGKDEMWTSDSNEERLFHPTVTPEQITEIVIKDMVKRPEARPPRYGLMLISPPENPDAGAAL